MNSKPGGDEPSTGVLQRPRVQALGQTREIPTRVVLQAKAAESELLRTQRAKLRRDGIVATSQCSVQGDTSHEHQRLVVTVIRL